MEAFLHFIETLHSLPILQAILAGIGTLVLEDPTAFGCGMLVACGKMNYWAAFWGLFGGIVTGDWGLFCIGRFSRKGLNHWRLVEESKLVTANKWFEKNCLLTLLGARFIPGMRFPTYTTAGFVRLQAPQFFTITVIGAFLWTNIMLFMAIKLGQQVVSLPNHWKLVISISIVLFLVVVQVAARSLRQRS